MRAMDFTRPDKKKKKVKKILNPGSIEAQNKGCLCPVMDNYYGKGFLIKNKKSFWINLQCPLHSKP